MTGLKDDIKKYESTLVVEEAKSLQAIINNVLKVIRDKPVIYIALIKPYDSILLELGGNGIKTDKIFFIDCVTEFAGGDTSKEKNVSFIREPTDLTGMGVAISRVLDSVPGKKYIIIDALRVLTIYNAEDVVLRFVQSLLENASRHDAKVVVMATKGKDEGLIKKVAGFFERIVDV